MPSCVMRYCTNYTGKTSKTQGITYHAFPTNELRCIEWVDIVRKQRNEEFWQPNKSSTICSIHFKDEDKYQSAKGYILLRKSACPILDIPKTQPIPGSPNSLNQENVSEPESTFDSRRKAALKKFVHRINLQKEKLINRNRNLKKQNKRLQRRVAHLSGIIKHLIAKNSKPDDKELSLKNEDTT